MQQPRLLQHSRALLGLLCLMLTACGQKGPLYLPKDTPTHAKKQHQNQSQGKQAHDTPLHEDAWTW